MCEDDGEGVEMMGEMSMGLPRVIAAAMLRGRER